MKFAVASLAVVSSALLGGCAVYPDGTPAYGGGYPATYDPGYGYYGYPGPVVQSGVYIGGGSYYGGPGPRYWDDSPGYRHRPPPGGWQNRPPGGGHGDHDGNQGGRPPQAGGGGGNHGGPPPAPPPQAGGGRPPAPAAVGGPPPARPAQLPQPNISTPGGPPQRQNLGRYGG
ncbi:Translation initiation factor IF-2 [Caballeronia glathei]|uniref:Lipoprotein n=1 Tax=Caballeronia glathei TaxID=60547 RepID=A0A069PUA5_9BURK|nr:hypothetical protein [Caballeronia glathei]KDR43419.1 hypothetical protein BG61_38515 [Caballeronia glathei]CDY78669.1 Translation initiation factor IF-2 [Caballeronia glathei]